MEASLSKCEYYLEYIRTSRGGPLCISSEHSFPTVFLSDRALHSGSGCALPPLDPAGEHSASGAVQNQTRERVSSVVAPKWPTQPWFQDLFEMLLDPPRPIPLRKDLLSQENGSIWHPNPRLWDMHIWPLYGVPQLQSHCPSR